MEFALFIKRYLGEVKMSKRCQVFCCILFFWATLFSPNCSKNKSEAMNLSPANWPAGELEEYAKLNQSFGVPKPSVEAKQGMVVGTSGALAVRAGIEALKQGGSAADAALTTALAQICLNAGSIVSYAGILTMVTYDAGTGKVHSMHAGWNTPLEEKDPLSIPFMGTPSGRQVLVPGFMAGIQAAHDRFGKLPFASIFEPSIYFAENGFELTPSVGAMIQAYQGLISSLPEIKQVFANKSGELYKAGELFTQPQLAETLKRVAAGGAAYMYKGEWAHQCVEAVQRHGGKLTLKDLENYEVLWSEPYHTIYRDFDIFTLGAPSSGGVRMIEAFNMLDLANLDRLGHWRGSGEALYWFIQISRAAQLIPIEGGENAEGPEVQKIIQNAMSIHDFSAQNLVSKNTAKLIWEKMKGPAWAEIKKDVFEANLEGSEAWEEAFKKFDSHSTQRIKMIDQKKNPGHSDAVVAVDRKGNITVIVHSINGGLWGPGIMVDGISLGDAASYQQRLIHKIGPGARIPDPTSPLIVVRDGKPLLSASCIGGGLHEAMLQAVINVLDFGMDPKKAVETPHFMTPVMLPSEAYKQSIGEGDFPDQVLDAVRAMGQELEIIPLARQSLQPGYWIGIVIDPKTGILRGGVPPKLNGLVVGH